jgi:hypothetical protein
MLITRDKSFDADIRLTQAFPAAWRGVAFVSENRLLPAFQEDGCGVRLS